MSSGSSALAIEEEAAAQSVKCVVWDLDHTLWEGVLLEDANVSLRPEVASILRILDERGILHSVASRNDCALAMEKLRQFGLADYFLWPQINWNPKSESVKEIATRLSLGLDTFAFVDDQPFEREEVAFAHPKVLCLDAAELTGIPALKRMHPRFITEESRTRRQMYQSDERRQEAEREFTGTNEEFLARLNMVFTISKLNDEDLKRAEELTLRTHQLNTTGYTYSYEQLDELRHSPDHLLLLAGLDDVYGSYGKIGLGVVELGPEFWTIKLLLMSCRVISRGVGTVLLTHVMKLGRKAGVKLRAEFISNDRNRMMLITYKFAGFREISSDGKAAVLENDLARTQEFPSYIAVRAAGSDGQLPHNGHV
jgi:FkbH-like protein